jgi:SAM-dependent methyltransferase
MTQTESRPICDYEGSTYRTDFWEGKGRDYEDQVERIALRRLMPASGARLLEVGAGFGRLSEMFTGYKQIVLLDYSRSQLEYARSHYGDEGFLYVAADIYRMPFAPGVFDAATMVRVLHHMQDPAAALSAIRYTMQKDSIFVLEYANKHNMKAILRRLMGLQKWNPFSYETYEGGNVYYNFHPRFVADTLKSSGFEPGRALTVSHFRVNLLKRLAPVGLLVAADSVVQLTGDWWKLSPSVFVRNRAAGDSQQAPDDAFWKCPACDSFDLTEMPEGLMCQGCGTHWARVNGVYDFKEPAAK